MDIKKAHSAPKCDQDVYVELPAETEVQADECGKVAHWLYGCCPAAQAWEEHYSALLVEHGLVRLKSVPVAFARKSRGLLGVVHGDDFVFADLDEDLNFVPNILEATYELTNRGRLGSGAGDVRKIGMPGRQIELTSEGVTWEGDPRHKDILSKCFGMDKSVKTLSKDGHPEDQSEGGQATTSRRR